ncbi:dihydroorotate dehydrogenase-like protein [Desulfopila inferna]|uniref:dihydroorotate dehydrogenase-like protein n=1 Tax=Desulfopila inferna TaxID=468528 RepID=UPI001964DBD8|nr:dihydroorotate dehydrogenase-like protein [Desulfopila inferna]MBM9605272.1 dihydroorotate dehydrogenase-like protein [Desulfopila inferna]
MDLSTTYLGFSLPHPLMPGASPLVDNLSTVKRLEDAGAAAIVMYSLFEEQIIADQERAVREVEVPEHTYAEALSYLPLTEDMRLGPDIYLENVAAIKKSVSVPVIASLNGVSEGGWLRYARLIEQAGADALELNIYFLADDPGLSGKAVEDRLLGVVRQVKQNIAIPVAVKISPFFSSISHFCKQLEEAGADGVLLFNRFYQPDIDVEELEILSKLKLSTRDELLLRLRWLAILSGGSRLSFGITGGVHTGIDVVKAVMCGAHAVQMVSALLRNQPEYLTVVRNELSSWLESHEYESLEQMRGSMTKEHAPDRDLFERVNYIRVLQGGPG